MGGSKGNNYMVTPFVIGVTASDKILTMDKGTETSYKCIYEFAREVR